MKNIIVFVFILAAAGLVGCQPMYWPGTQAQRAAAQPKPPKQNLASAQTDAWNDAREKQLKKQREKQRILDEKLRAFVLSQAKQNNIALDEKQIEYDIRYYEKRIDKECKGYSPLAREVAFDYVLAFFDDHGHMPDQAFMDSLNHQIMLRDEDFYVDCMIERRHLRAALNFPVSAEIVKEERKITDLERLICRAYRYISISMAYRMPRYIRKQRREKADASFERCLVSIKYTTPDWEPPYIDIVENFGPEKVKLFISSSYWQRPGYLY